MYNLIVSRFFEERTDGSFKLARNRFLEYTSDRISVQLETLSAEAIECLCSWPCILMQEGHSIESARIGRVTSVSAARYEINVNISTIPVGFEILNHDLWEHRGLLDIADFEFSRNHWAIKERDLFSALSEIKGDVGEHARAQFSETPLPAPNRRQLVAARNAIAEWSHSDISDFLFEAGVDGLELRRDGRTRRDRALAIVQFAIENPDAVTIENSLFAAHIVKHALGTEQGPTQEGDLGQEHPRTPGESTTDVTIGARADDSRAPDRVFVVHGQNEETRSEVVTFLRSLGLEAVVLHEQASKGRHLLKKFIDEAGLVAFAVVIMTGDDLGGPSASELKPRARQNVILELGYFLHYLGQSRVCALVAPGIESPSDVHGVVYVSMRDDYDWKAELRRELVAAGMPVVEST